MCSRREQNFRGRARRLTFSVPLPRCPTQQTFSRLGYDFSGWPRAEHIPRIEYTSVDHSMCHVPHMRAAWRPCWQHVGRSHHKYDLWRPGVRFRFSRMPAALGLLVRH